jgi:hypothetical protein
MEVEKKIWPNQFQATKSGERRFELRIADFDIKKGDTLILREWDPRKKKYTGKALRKKCRMIVKFNPMDFNTLEEIERFGFYLIELADEESE